MSVSPVAMLGLLLGSLVAGCADYSATASGEAPVPRTEQEDIARFERVWLGETQAQIEKVYGHPHEWRLEYGSGTAIINGDILTIAVFEGDTAVSLTRFNRAGREWDYGDETRKPDWPIERSMSRSSPEALIGKPRRSCAFYAVWSTQKFCYVQGKLVDKARQHNPPPV